MTSTWLQQIIHGHYMFTTKTKGYLIEYRDQQGALCLLNNNPLGNLKRGVEIDDVRAIEYPSSFNMAARWLENSADTATVISYSLDLMKSELECPEDLKFTFIIGAMHDVRIGHAAMLTHEEYMIIVNNFVADHALQLSILESDVDLAKFKTNLEHQYMTIENRSYSRYTGYLDSIKRGHAILENAYGPCYRSILLNEDSK